MSIFQLVCSSLIILLSDDEDDFVDPDDDLEMADSDFEKDPDRIVEYDSEENEV